MSARPSQALVGVNLVGVGFQFVNHQLTQFQRHAGGDFQMDRLAAAAALQCGFVGPHQVLGFFLEFHVGVADHPEQAVTGQPKAGKHPVQEQHDQVVQQDEAHRSGGVVGRQADEAFDLAGQRQQAAHANPVILTHQVQRQDEAEIGDERERMRRNRRPAG